MRQKERRLNVSRLFVMGAGSSFCATRRSSMQHQAPLDMDFTTRMLNIDVEIPRWVKICRDFIKKEWRDEQPFTSFGLEQAILRQLGHLEFIDAIHPHRKKTSVTDYRYMNDLSHLICFILRRAREHRNGPLEQFATRVFPPGTAYEDLKDRIVTFNYDELLEKHLFPRFDIRQLYFDDLKVAPDAPNHGGPAYPFPLILKLHGSVNWRCTKDEFENIVRAQPADEENHRVEPVWFSQVNTPAPEDDSSPLIMPPLPVKPITHVSLFRFLWTRAYEYLHEAEELVVCGYSLPDADRMARSLFSNFRNPALRQITIVDPNPEVLAKWRALLQRRNVAKARWMYYSDFQEFVDDMP